MYVAKQELLLLDMFLNVGASHHHKMFRGTPKATLLTSPTRQALVLLGGDARLSQSSL